MPLLRSQYGYMGGFAAILLLVLASGPGLASAEERFEFASYKDVERLFKKLGYTREAWQAGIREVPRAFLTGIPRQWKDRYSKEITVATKKRIFFRSLAPLLLRSNELIMEDRQCLEDLKRLADAGHDLSDDDRHWLSLLATEYGVIGSPADDLDGAGLAELLNRVDIIPLSIALSQAAEESGWGTSRFAVIGNSLFGQWTWGKGMKPRKQRRLRYGDYKIRAFESPLESVRAYALNLNTHRAYKELRARRAELRRNGQPIEGKALVGTLGRYSERGHAYINTLKTIIRVNQLEVADEAYLGNGPVIYLVPIESS